MTTPRSSGISIAPPGPVSGLALRPPGPEGAVGSALSEGSVGSASSAGSAGSASSGGTTGLPPWLEEDERAAWLLAARSGRPLHPFVLLGEEAAGRHSAYLERRRACLVALENLKARHESAAQASALLGQARFRAVVVACLELGEWAAEVERFRTERPAWYALAERVATWCADDEFSPGEQRVALEEAAALGLDEAWLRAFVAQRFPRARWVEARGELLLKGYFAELVPRSASELAELVLEGPERWAQAQARWEALPLLLLNQAQPAAQALLVSVEAAREEAGAFAARAGMWAESERAQLGLCCLLRQLGHGGLGVPEPWSRERLRSPGELLLRLGADRERLVPAVQSGRLALWLHQEGAEAERVAELLRARGQPEEAALRLLCAMGERRLRVGERIVDGPEALGRAALREPQAWPELDRLLQSGLLRVWGELTGRPEVGLAADRAALQAQPELRRRALAWGLGEPELVEGVAGLAELERWAARAPAELVEELREGRLQVWAQARGLSARLPALEPGQGAERAAHEALWALGGRALLAAGRPWAHPGELLSRLDEDRDLDELMSALVGLEAQGLLGAWPGAQATMASGPAELRARQRLWAWGWRGWHHPATGRCREPVELARWGDERPQRFQELLAEGWVEAWLQSRAPELVGPVAALAPHRDRLELSLRALGLSTPSLSVEPAVLDLGQVEEGQGAQARLRLRHLGARGSIRVQAEALSPLIAVEPGPAGPDESFRLLPGEERELILQLHTPPGRPTRLAGPGLRLLVDGAPRSVELRLRTRIDRAFLLRRMAQGALLGLGLVVPAGAALLWAAQGRLHDDLGLPVADPALVGSDPEASGLGWMALAMLSLGGAALFTVLSLSRAGGRR